MPHPDPNHHTQRAIAVALTLFGLALGAVGLASASGAALHGQGPAQRYGVPIGLLCFAALLTLVIGYRKWHGRFTRFEPQTRATRLYTAVNAILIAAVVLVPVTIILAGRHSGKTFTGPPAAPQTMPPPTGAATPAPNVATTPAKPYYFPLTAVLIVLGVLAAIVVGLLIWRWLRLVNLRMPAGTITSVEPPQDDAEEQRVLADAMYAGQRALDGDDARAAIIACYAAMEGSLAEAGVARGRADSPAELLDRALARGVLRGAGPGALAELFREARFSTHPMGPEQVAAARAALEESTRQLRETPAAVN